MATNNQDIRQAAKKANIKLWRIADKLNITDVTFSKKLRKNLTNAEKLIIIAIIADLRKEQADEQ